MSKCNYCDFGYKDEKDYLKHLNETHTKCFYCGKVFNNNPDDYAVCAKCGEVLEDD